MLLNNNTSHYEITENIQGPNDYFWNVGSLSFISDF
jgi:hypothetical protein